jgi:hypothetical protein
MSPSFALSVFASAAAFRRASVSSLPGGVLCVGCFGAGRFARVSELWLLARELGLAWCVVAAPFPGGSGVSLFVAASPVALGRSRALASALGAVLVRGLGFFSGGPAAWRGGRRV